MNETKIAALLYVWGYENIHLIGKGAFAQVYRVREKQSGRVIACKVSENEKMLLRENDILQQVKHPLFPNCYGVRQKEELAFLLMEYVPGVNLETLLRRRGSLSERQTARIGMRLAEGLFVLHALPQPVLFLDLKPENIVIRENGEVKLLDFGSAGTIEQNKSVLTGTLGYAAPEQFQTGGKVGAYSDVYALGMLMYRLCPSGSLGFRQVLEGCIRERSRERIPDMRCFLRRIRPYASERKKDRFIAEMKAYVCRRKSGEYYFQKNIVQNSQKNLNEKL